MRTTAAARARHRSRAAAVVAPALLAAVLLAAWEGAVASGAVDEAFLPRPSAIAARLVEEAGRGVLAGYAATTLIEAIVGTLLAVVVALPLGYFIARVRWVDLAASPYATASQAIPAVAIAPLLVLWVGYGLAPIAILCAIIAFFPMLVTTVLGFRQLPADVIDAARLDGANAAQLLVHIEAPLAAPSMLAGVRAGAALSVTGAIVGEFTMGGRGLGMLLTLYRDANDTVGLFATLVVLAFMAVGLFALLRLVEWFAFRDRTVRDADRPVPEPDPTIGALGSPAEGVRGDRSAPERVDAPAGPEPPETAAPEPRAIARTSNRSSV